MKQVFTDETKHYYGHGVGTFDEEKMASIFTNGLRCSHNYMYFTTNVLGPGGEETKEYVENLEEWSHLDSRQVVIVSLPEEYEILDSGALSYQGQEAFCYEVSHKEAEERNIAQGKYVKPEFIRGYWDIDEKMFIENESYYENQDEEVQKNILEETRKKYIDTIKQSEFTLREYREIAEEIGMKHSITDADVLEEDSMIEDINDEGNYLG